MESFQMMMEREKRPSFWRRVLGLKPDPRIALIAAELRQLCGDLEILPERVSTALDVMLRKRKEPCSIVVLGMSLDEPRVPLLWAHTAWLRPEEEREGGFIAQTALVDLTVIAFGAGRLRRVIKGVRLIGTANLDGELPLARIERMEAGERLTITVVR